MIIYIEGDINRYYVQTLCMIFFPGAKFSENEELTEHTPVLRVRAVEEESGVMAEASITVGETVASHSHFESYKLERAYTRQKTVKIAAGVVVFGAGEKLFGHTPSWGILTGVRPSKIAAELLRSGLDMNESRHVLTEEYLVNPKKASLAVDVAIHEARILGGIEENTCSVYISIPFCPTRCAYCSFVSYSTKRLLALIPDYLDRLCRDIDRMFATIRSIGQRVATVYIGGGTPTILDETQLSRLLSCVERNVDVSSLLEYTIEAGRPDTITEEKLRVIAEHGATRVSINPQTLNDTVLEAIGRRHTTDDFMRAYDMACRSGIKYINVDMIAGLPGESFLSFSRGTDAILRMRPANVTFHTFCVKKAADILKSDTEIYSPAGGDTGKSVDYSQVKAKIAGYIPYYMYRQKNTVGNLENVGFSLQGAEGLYNILIMEEIHSIFAIGAGAVTKLVSHKAKKINRIFMPKYPYEYLDEQCIEEFDAMLDKIQTFYMENM